MYYIVCIPNLQYSAGETPYTLNNLSTKEKIAAPDLEVLLYFMLLPSSTLISSPSHDPAVTSVHAQSTAHHIQFGILQKLHLLVKQLIFRQEYQK